MGKTVAEIAGIASCLGVAVAASALGGVTGAAAAGSFGASIAANFGHELCKRFGARAQAYVESVWRLDKNEHIRQGLRRTQIAATRALLHLWRQRLPERRAAPDDRRLDFADSVAAWCDAQGKDAAVKTWSRAPRPADAEDATKSLRNAFESAFANEVDASAGMTERARQARQLALQQAFADVIEGVVARETPGHVESLAQQIREGEGAKSFRQTFFGEDGAGGDWFDLFLRAIGGEFKADAEFKHLWDSAQLAAISAMALDDIEVSAERHRELKQIVDGQSEYLASLLGDIKSGVERIDERTDRVEQGQKHLLEGQAEILAFVRAHQAGDWPPDPTILAAIASFIAIKPDARPNEIVAEIEKFADGYRRLKVQVAALTLNDNHIQSLKTAAEEALAAGDLDSARARLGEAKTAARGKASEPVCNTAALAVQEADAAMLGRDWRAADAAWSEAEEILAPFDRTAAEDIGWDAAKRLQEFGHTFIDNDVLFRTNDRLQLLKQAAKERNDLSSVVRYADALGRIFSTIGEWAIEPEGERFRSAACDEFLEALKALEIEKDDVKMAKVQVHLGSVMELQSQRTKGLDAQSYIDAALQAYEAALEVLTKKDFPSEWATTHVYIGGAFFVAGNLAPSQQEGVKLFRMSMSAFRLAESVFTEKKDPEMWAEIQSNAGITLMEASKWVEKEMRLKLAFDAIAAQKAALRVYSETETPNAWASVQTNLGAGFLDICRRVEGQDWDKLRAEGIAACEAALRVLTPERHPSGFELATKNLQELQAMRLADRPSLNLKRSQAHAHPENENSRRDFAQELFSSADDPVDGVAFLQELYDLQKSHPEDSVIREFVANALDVEIQKAASRNDEARFDMKLNELLKLSVENGEDAIVRACFAKTLESACKSANANKDIGRRDAFLHELRSLAAGSPEDGAVRLALVRVLCAVGVAARLKGESEDAFLGEGISIICANPDDKGLQDFFTSNFRVGMTREPTS